MIIANHFMMSTAFMFCMTDPLFNAESEPLFPLSSNVDFIMFYIKHL